MASASPAASGWPRAGLTLGAVILLAFALFWPTFMSMAEVWERSETFAHGYTIFPISLWLIWRRRLALARMSPRADGRGLVAMALAAAGWLLADAGSVNVVAQYAFIAILISTVWAILGWAVVWALFFPLMFLFFAVPVGEFLIQPLMGVTADFTVAMLQFTGIPVYREGTFFSIPSGDWSVVEGCSGLRYLIASATLGVLYAYLTYRSWKRRLLFSIAAVIVPIFANSGRAYMIVMIAHLSDMKLALGVDHYIYGWVFFGFVMLLLFWIGSFWREDDQPEPAASFTSWTPHWVGADRQVREAFARDQQSVLLEINYYAAQRQDAELVNSQNFMIRQKDPHWSNVGESLTTVEIAGRPYPVRQAKMRGADGQRLLVWQWNVVNGQPTVNDLAAKLVLALDRVRGARDDGASVLIATPYDDVASIDTARATLARFAADMQPAIARSLAAVEAP